MSVREGVRAYLSEQEVLRASLYVAGLLGLALLALWPRGSLETALRTGAASDTFTVVAICFLLALLYLGARWGAEDYAANPTVQLHEYVTMTPVSLLSLVSGRLLVGLLHTLVMLLLGAPFLVAAMAVGGAGVPEAFRALAVIGAASLAARMCGLLTRTLIGTRRPLREILLFLVLAAVFGSTFFVAPAVSPFSALAGLLNPAEESSVSIRCALAYLAVAVLLAACALAVLTGTRVRARARAGRAARGERAASDRHE
jgi:uncharacterized membrane protein